MRKKQIKSLGLYMGCCSNFYLKTKYLIDLINHQVKIRRNLLKNQIFQIVTKCTSCLFHVKQLFSPTHRYTSPISISYLSKGLHEIFFNGDRSYIQFPMPFIFLKDGVAKASGFAL